jgi:hypothetical protein
MHDLSLYEELKSYRQEVEQRFNSSTVNGVYKFPFQSENAENKDKEVKEEDISKDKCNPYLFFIVLNRCNNPNDNI